MAAEPLADAPREPALLAQLPSLQALAQQELCPPESRASVSLAAEPPVVDAQSALVSSAPSLWPAARKAQLAPRAERSAEQQPAAAERLPARQGAEQPEQLR